MIYLTLEQQLRVEQDMTIVDILRRKGWVDAPIKPTQDAIWHDGGWMIPPPPPPTPDWLSFKAAMLSSPEVNSAMGQATPLAPLAVFSLPAALNAAVTGDTSDFAVTWTTLREAGLIPQPVLDAVAATAVACELPGEFVQVLNPPSVEP